MSKTKIVKAIVDLWDVKDRALTLNKQDEPCSICGINKGIIKIHDDDEKEYWICESCDENIKWGSEE